jgi:hypothetical protein
MDAYIRVTPDGCHEWQGNKFQSGYGRIKVGGREHRAHRFIWTCAVGPIPDGKLVLHRCDNPPCVRLDHLFLGTNADNSADMANKGRASRNLTKVYASGEMHHNAKLSDEQVLELRRRYEAGGLNQAALAIQYGVSQALVSQIVRGVHR